MVAVIQENAKANVLEKSEVLTSGVAESPLHGGPGADLVVRPAQTDLDLELDGLLAKLLVPGVRAGRLHHLVALLVEGKTERVLPEGLRAVHLRGKPETELVHLGVRTELYPDEVAFGRCEGERCCEDISVVGGGGVLKQDAESAVLALDLEHPQVRGALFYILEVEFPEQGELLQQQKLERASQSLAYGLVLLLRLQGAAGFVHDPRNLFEQVEVGAGEVPGQERFLPWCLETL